MASPTLFAEIFKPERDARVAVMFEQRDITYSELRTLTLNTAEKLKALDVRAGARVAILLNDSPEFIVLSSQSFRWGLSRSLLTWLCERASR
jgi:acyl-CoA synthetase (AMP-forming)/AMP-acid ligase II